MASTGILHYLQTSDAITHGVAYVLAAMSIASWCFLIVKGWMLGRAKRQGPRALAVFWQASTLPDGIAAMKRAHMRPSSANSFMIIIGAHSGPG